MPKSDGTGNNNNYNKRPEKHIPPLAFLLPTKNPDKRLFKGQSFVNLPPLSRIEQNALLLSSSSLSHRRVSSSEKFANYMNSSPPDSPASCSSFGLADNRLLHPSHSHGRMSVPNPRHHSSPVLRPEQLPLAVSPQRQIPIGQPMTGEDDGVEKILLAEDGSKQQEEFETDDVEAGHGRPVAAAFSAASAPDKSSLKSSLKVEDKILRLNIGGSSYRIRTRSILKHGADTLLGRFVRMNEHHRRAWVDAYFEDEDEYFFERVPRYFDPVYDFYASGKLHVPKDLCFDKFMAELRFWAVSKAKMNDCCSPFAQYCLIKKSQHFDTPEKDHFIGLRCSKVRRRLWLILEGHSRSKWWKFFEITSTSFVVLSITALILASMPEFQVPDLSTQGGQSGPGTIYPTYAKATGHTISTTTVIKAGEEHRIEMVEHPVFNYVENICVIYFTLEYLLRFWVAPQKAQFVKEFLNVIDLLAIAPFVFELILVFIGIRGDNVRKVRPGLANFALTLRKSKKQMQMVAIVLLTVIVFFSTLVYFLEKDEPNTTFTSIPAAFWWCLFSQTKWVPQTAAGKIVGGGAITCGVLVLALPIAILVNNFMQVVRLREEKVLKQYASIAAGGCQQHSAAGADRV
ncbi:hypothetical protein GPALN_014735 [Globodera pallida]|nr:hypothetical protein GPALN_014735 [Globodera pallida]